MSDILSEEGEERFVDALMTSSSINAAARRCGVTNGSLHHWRRDYPDVEVAMAYNKMKSMVTAGYKFESIRRAIELLESEAVNE